MKKGCHKRGAGKTVFASPSLMTEKNGSLDLVEDRLIVFRDDFSREDVEEADDDHGESDPIETSVQRNTQDSSQKWQNDAQKNLIEEIWEEQHSQQTQDDAKEENFPYDGDASVFAKRANQLAGFNDVQEDIPAFGASHFSWLCITGCLLQHVRGPSW